MLRGRSRRFQVLVLCVLVLVTFEGLYLVVANALLRSRSLASWISHRPEKLHVEWAAAWSVWPGRVHATALRIRGQNRHLQWFASADEARLTIDLLPLAFKRFKATRVRGSGLTFLLARRLDDEDAAKELDPALWPSIPGLTNPPHPAPEELYPRRHGKHPWRIVLRDIDIESVKQLWIDRFDYDGDGRVRGSFAYWIRNDLEVEHGTIELRSGTLKVGDRAMAQELDARIDGSLARFVPHLVHGVAVLDQFSGKVDVQADVESLAFVNTFLRKARWLSIDGEGTLETHLAVERGRLVPESQLALDAPRIVARFPHYEARGSGTLRGGMASASADAPAEIAVRFDDFTISRTPGDRVSIEGQGFDIRATVHDPALGHGFQELDLAIELPPSRLTNFDVYNFYFPPESGLRLGRGSGTLRASLAIHSATHTGQGEIELAGRDVDVQFEDLHIVGDLRALGRLSETTPRGDTVDDDAYVFDIGGSELELNRVHTSSSPSSEPGDWWAKLSIDRGTMTLGEPLALQAHVGASMRDSGPLVAVFTERNRLAKWFDGLLTVKDVRGAAELELGQAIELRDLQVTGRHMELQGRLRLGQGTKRGLLFAKLGLLSVGVKLEGAKRDWKLLNARDWFERASRDQAQR
jgi:hypothetical protein